MINVDDNIFVIQCMGVIIIEVDGYGILYILMGIFENILWVK